MSDTSQGPGWWQADNGQWYPAEARSDFNVWRYGAATRPGPKWWMADDGRWYPPKLVPKKRWSTRKTLTAVGGACLLFVVLAVIGATSHDEAPSAEYQRVQDECSAKAYLTHPELDANRQVDVAQFSAYVNRCMVDTLGIDEGYLPKDKPIAPR